MLGGLSANCFTANFATPITITLVERETSSAQWVSFVLWGNIFSSCNFPFEITEYSPGAVTMNSNVALSSGSSLQGIQLCARFGQLSAKKVLSPYRLFEMIRPSEGIPL